MLTSPSRMESVGLWWKSAFSCHGIDGPALMPTNTIVTGPVAGGRRGWPFSLPLTDLASVGYVAEEFFLDGTAAADEADPGAELTVDGECRVRPSRTAAFRTRMLVVRPVDRTFCPFSGGSVALGKGALRILSGCSAICVGAAAVVVSRMEPARLLQSRCEAVR